MKIKVIAAHNVDGMGGVPEGTILDVDVHEARRKIAMGYAEAYIEPLPPEEGVARFDESALKPKGKGKK